MAVPVWRNVYIHVPFCASKCAYCAFYSEAGRDAAARQAYLDKLERDLAAATFAEPVATVYIGGGTPSCLSVPELTRLMAMLQKYLPLAVGAEVSSEANPESLTREKLDILGTAINRLSVGVQSFSARWRARLERRVTREELEKALELTAACGIKRINFDLIYAIAGQTPADWESDLTRALATGVEHLSGYALTLEENTRLALDPRAVPDDADAADWWLATGRRLAAAGLNRYEVSNYARPGAECRHNGAIWRGETLLGLGPAASGFDGVNRSTQVASLDAWLAGAEPEADIITPELRYMEIAAVNLRTVRGWSREPWEALALQQHREFSWPELLAVLARVAERQPGWWEVTPERAALTETGLLYWNDVAMELLAQAPASRPEAKAQVRL